MNPKDEYGNVINTLISDNFDQQTIEDFKATTNLDEITLSTKQAVKKIINERSVDARRQHLETEARNAEITRLEATLKELEERQGKILSGLGNVPESNRQLMFQESNINAKSHTDLMNQLKKLKDETTVEGKLDMDEEINKMTYDENDALNSRSNTTSYKYNAVERDSGYTEYKEEVIIEDLTDLSDAPETVWKNPRPSSNNKKIIQKYDLVLIDGYPIMLQVVDVTKLTATVLINNKQKAFPVEKVHPVYAQDEPATEKLAAGNIIGTSSRFKYFIVKTIEDSLVITTNGKHINKEGITQVYTKNKRKELYTKFACGGIVFKDTKFKTLKALKEAHQGVSFSPDEMPLTLEYHDISKHYKIAAEDIKPKETGMMEMLTTALDDPLNVLAKEWALVYGPSGSGKTELIIAYANSKNQKYIKLQGHGQLSADDLVGYKSITDGTYFPSLLRDAVENGHLFILDEIDACNANTLITLNGIKQEYFQFPDKLVKVHKDFRFAATANALEYSEEYNARAPMDKATLERFDLIKYDMKDHELAVRYGIDYIKQIDHIDRLTPRGVSRLVTKLKIEESKKAKELKKYQDKLNKKPETKEKVA